MRLASHDKHKEEGVEEIVVTFRVPSSTKAAVLQGVTAEQMAETVKSWAKESPFITVTAQLLGGVATTGALA